MDQIAQEALSSLGTVISGYLPPVASPNVSRNLLTLPKSIKPTGIGAYVGQHSEPMGDLYGRYVEADAEITVSANPAQLDAINETLQLTTNALLTNDKQTLRQDGIFSIQLLDVSSSDLGSQISRIARFKVRYEFIKTPEEAGGVIEELVIRQQLNPSDNAAKFIFSQDFADLAELESPFDNFIAVTDPDINASSPDASWEYNDSELRIEQLNNVRGGGLRANVKKKAGAQLLIRPNANPLNIADFSITISLSSADADGIGAVFRREDDDNYYFFLMSTRHDYHLLGKKVAGEFEFFNQGHLNDTLGFTQNQIHEVRIVCIGSKVEVYLDEEITLSGEDSDLTGKGEIGFLTHGNSKAYFHAVDIIAYDG